MRKKNSLRFFSISGPFVKILARSNSRSDVRKFQKRSQEDVPTSSGEVDAFSENEVIHFCHLQLVETVPDVLQERGLSRQMTQKSIYDVGHTALTISNILL